MTPWTTGGCRASARCRSSASRAAQVQRRALRDFLVDQFGECGQRLPPLACPGSRRRLGAQPQRFQHATDDLRKWPVHIAIGRALQRHQRLADLLAAEEPLPATDLEGDARLGQRLLVDLGLRVDAVQHRDLRGCGARLDESLDVLGHRGGLGDLVGVFGERGLRTGVALADQVQLATGHPAAGGGDDAVGQRHHLRGGPVVTLEAHHCGVGKAPREVQQILRRGAGERIDGLVGVADDREVVAVAQPCVEHTLLQRGDVLVFVDHEAAVPVAELLGDRRVVLDGGGGVQQQVVEVQQRRPVAAGLERLVPRVHRRDLGRVERDVTAGRRDGGADRPPD